MPLLKVLMNAAYLLLVVAAAPVLLYRAIVQRKYREGWGEKLFGNLPRRRSDRPRVWVHAVSVGEVLQLHSLLRELAGRYPDHEFLITTTTSTGHAVAREKFPQHAVCYFPLDFSWAVRRALRRVRPAAVVLVELELWPNFILAASQFGVPLALINGRVSERSFRGYRRIRPLMRRLLGRFAVLAAQNEEYADRLRRLGAPADRVRVTGSIKFDHIETDCGNPRTAELRLAFGISEGQRVFIAGSTQAPEEEYALDTWRSLRDEFPDLRLIVVPRHKERFEEVARLIASRGLPLLRRSATRSGAVVSPNSSGPPVLLLDTLGELAACWGLANIAFVGGSLTNRGGQNMIEPAGYGAAVLFGPNTWNFREVTDALLSRDAARVVTSGEQLTDGVRACLADPTVAGRLGATAQAFVLSQQGATARTAAAIGEVLESKTTRVRAA